MKYKVVKYGAPWCGACTMMGPYIERAKIDFPEVSFEDVDVSLAENQCFLEEYKIIAIPAFICFRDGKMVSKTTGALSYQELSELVKNLINE